MVSKLSIDLLKLLGAKYSLDYDLWAYRLRPGDREYFATPLNERGE
jgi:hypothetical protein